MTIYAYTVTDNTILVLDQLTGHRIRITADNPNFQRAQNLVRAGDFAAVLQMDISKTIADWGVADGDYKVFIKDGTVVAELDGLKVPVPDVLVARVLKMVEQKFSPRALVNFTRNLMRNPSPTAVNELILFLEHNDLPLTGEGYFVAYKMVRSDYTSIYDSSFKNVVGTQVSMDRSGVNQDRNQTCSTGLHFCSREYLSHYGSSNPETDRLLLLMIDPADVVSIPSDYNNAKGRAWRYTIWRDITETDFRKKFANKDFTDQAVVTTAPPASVVHTCPSCGSTDTIGKGTDTLADGSKKVRRKCKDCGKNFYL